MVKYKFIVPLLLLLMAGLPSCHVARYFFWNVSDINDHNKFPSVKINAGEKNFSFVHLPLNIDLNSLVPDQESSFEAWIAKNHTLAFLVIKDDTVFYENFFDGYGPTSAIPIFSVSKSFISALIGIAIGEGKIQNTEQKVGDFLGGFKDPAINNISIEDLLNMRSGIKFTEDYYNPFSLTPKFYYGLNLKKYVHKLKTTDYPGLKYDYQSANAQLLGMILEKTTGKAVNEYLSEKLWIPLGMEYDASWNIDSRRHRTVKSFCCINAMAYDLARFGRLYQHLGKWEGRQLVPESWVLKTMSIINDSKDSQGYAYTYQWRVMTDGSIFAKGVLGQYIYISPAKKLVIVRLGSKTGDIHWPRLFERINRAL